jgi:hypothetical protein
MHPMFYTALGAVLVCLAWLAFLVVKHGWGWVLAKLQARAARLEADAKAKTDAVLGPIEKRMSSIEADLAQIKMKLVTPAPAPAPTSAPQG